VIVPLVAAELVTVPVPKVEFDPDTAEAPPPPTVTEYVVPAAVM
jgi:hypothetical protein